MKKLLSLIIVMLLVGCGATKEIIPVVQTKNILIVPPDELMVKCDVKTPPAVNDYVAGSWQEKEQMLIVYSSDLMKNLFKCNNMITSLQNWKKSQTDIYTK